MPIVSSKAAPLVLASIAAWTLFFAITFILPLIQARHFEIYQLEMEGKTYEIKYDIFGSKLQSIEAYPESLSLVIDIEEAAEQGHLAIQLDRADMAELLGNDGQNALAFVDGMANTIAMDLAEDTVTVTVDFRKGSKGIELVGAVHN